MANKFDVDVTGDVAAVVTMPRQLPFAAQKALNTLADRARTNVVASLDAGLEIRGGWMKQNTKYGINVLYAKKSNLQASLYTRADWLLEEEGFNHGVKKPDGVSKAVGRVPSSLAVPNIPNARPSFQSKMPVSQKAGKLLKNAKRTKAFIMTSKKGTRLVMQRVGVDASGNDLRDKRGNLRIGRKSERASSRLVLKAVLQKSVRVPQKKLFVTTAVKTMNVRHLNDLYRKQLLIALRTAKYK